MTSVSDLRFIVLYISILTNSKAIELAVMGQSRRLVYEASRLECVKLMLSTASNQRTFRFSLGWDSNAEAAELVASTCGSRRKTL